MHSLLYNRKYTYNVKEYQTSPQQFNQYYEFVRTQSNMQTFFRIEGTTNKNVKFLVHFLAGSGDDIKFGKREAEKLLIHMQSENIKHLFLVVFAPITTYAMQVLQDGCTLEVWNLNQCLSDYIHQFTNPVHRKLSTKEKKQFYQELSVGGAQLPKMNVGCPTARYWDFQAGDVVEIERKTHAGIAIEKRVVKIS
ncbi:hypothetical protein OAM67_01160 [bacterium]|nr:hypothetical protein [bacterium]